MYPLIHSDVMDRGYWHWGGKQIDIYNALSPLLKWMLIDKMIPWNAIIDDHRHVIHAERFSNAQEFIDQEVDGFLTGFSRCLAQGQPRHIELWIEKNTLAHVLKPVALKYCRRLVVCRGYNSITFQSDFHARAMMAMDAGQIPTVLYFGDHDPSGRNMLHAAKQTIETELGLYGVEYYRAGINEDHFNMIPVNPVPPKMTDTRSEKFIDEYGPDCYELDALHPNELQKIAEAAIVELSDMEIYEKHYEKEVDESIKIEDLRYEIIDFIEDETRNFG